MHMHAVKGCAHQNAAHKGTLAGPKGGSHVYASVGNMVNGIVGYDATACANRHCSPAHVIDIVVCEAAQTHH